MTDKAVRITIPAGEVFAYQSYLEEIAAHAQRATEAWERYEVNPQPEFWDEFGSHDDHCTYLLEELGRLMARIHKRKRRP